MEYFSERESGERPRNREDLTHVVWSGIKSEIAARISDGSFGASYPETCDDGGGPTGTHQLAFWNAMRARIPSLEERPWLNGGDQLPPIHDAMDMIEFCWRSTGKVIKGSYHPYFKHYHLDFDVEKGRTEFEEAINDIFRRNGLAFQLGRNGRIHRLVPPVLHEALANVFFVTGDVLLDGMLEDARQKFINPDEGVRREGLEKLWDAFERIKTLEPGACKAVQAKLLLDKTASASGPKFRHLLDSEAFTLTHIGNNFQIRHSETTQEPLSCSRHVDYLFHRLFAFVSLVLRATDRM